jgi:hypothetical protein
VIGFTGSLMAPCNKAASKPTATTPLTDFIQTFIFHSCWRFCVMSITEREAIVPHHQYFYPPADCHAQEPPAVDAAPDRKGRFGPLLDALHDSRRQQASRAIHLYRHLIAAPRSVKAGASQTAARISEQPKGRIKMTTSDDANGQPHSHSMKTLTSNRLTWALIAACVIGFGILHIAGGAIINGAVKPSAEIPPVQLHGD